MRVHPHPHNTPKIEVLSDGTYRIRVKALPVDGEANRALLDYLEALSGMRYRIIRGATGRQKLLRRGGASQ